MRLATEQPSATWRHEPSAVGEVASTESGVWAKDLVASNTGGRRSGPLHLRAEPRPTLPSPSHSQLDFSDRKCRWYRDRVARGDGEGQQHSRWFGQAVPTVAGGLLAAVASCGLILALGSVPAGAAALTSDPSAAARAVTLASTSPISPTRSNVSAWSTSAPTGSSGTVTVTLLNANGLPVSGKMVTLTAPGSHIVVTPQSDPTNGNGQASFIVSDSKAEAATFTAFDWTDGITVSRHPCTTFGGPGTPTPETPVTLALPVIAAGLLGGTAFLARRRRAASTI